MAIKVIVDSTSYIPKDIIKKYDMTILPLSVVFEDEEIKETDITNEAFYQKLAQQQTIPTSSQPPIGEVFNIFERIILQGHAILGVFISSEMSGTFQTANMVKDMILDQYPDAQIELVDSRSNCMQLGYAAIAGAKAANEGKTLSEAVTLVNENIKRSKFIFSPDTLEYLKRGGRIGAAQALLGSILQLKPILTVTDGKTDVITKVRTKKKSIEKMLEIFADDVAKYGLGGVIVHHINSEEVAQKIADRVKEIVDVAVDICPIGPVIGVHVGPGSVGLAYYTKESMR